MKVANLLLDKGSRYEALFLSMPWEMEDLIYVFNIGEISLNELIERAIRSKLIPEPAGSWLYYNKPILESLPIIRKRFPELTLHCYQDSLNELAAMDIAVKLTQLTLRTALTEEVDVEAWMRTLQEAQKLQKKAIETEAKQILERIKERNICISEMGGRSLKKPLTRLGIDVKINYSVSFYHFTPLSILKRKITQRQVNDYEVERYVKEHLNYIKNYIYMFKNRDRAYYEWVYESVPWLRYRINRQEIEALDKILN